VCVETDSRVQFRKKLRKYKNIMYNEFNIKYISSLYLKEKEKEMEMETSELSIVNQLFCSDCNLMMEKFA
jgi:hypothetical protein